MRSLFRGVFSAEPRKRAQQGKRYEEGARDGVSLTCQSNHRFAHGGVHCIDRLVRAQAVRCRMFVRSQRSIVGVTLVQLAIYDFQMNRTASSFFLFLSPVSACLCGRSDYAVVLLYPARLLI